MLSDRYSIAYSLAYVRVVEWANGDFGASRPKPEILAKALKHAQRLEDFYIIHKVREAYEIWDTIEETPTPRECHPGATKEALEMEEEITKHFRVFRRPSCEVIVFDIQDMTQKVPLAIPSFSEEE